jgi:hypothetical protein
MGMLFFGFDHCKYTSVRNAISSDTSIHRLTYDASIGDEDVKTFGIKNKIISGMHDSKFFLENSIKRCCKAA